MGKTKFFLHEENIILVSDNLSRELQMQLVPISITEAWALRIEVCTAEIFNVG